MTAIPIACPYVEEKRGLVEVQLKEEKKFVYGFLEDRTLTDFELDLIANPHAPKDDLLELVRDTLCYACPLAEQGLCKPDFYADRDPDHRLVVVPNASEAVKRYILINSVLRIVLPSWVLPPDEPIDELPRAE